MKFRLLALMLMGSAFAAGQEPEVPEKPPAAVAIPDVEAAIPDSV